MLPPARHALLLAGTAAYCLMAVGSGPQAGLQAASTGPAALQDTDGDGLHDLLEVRIGTLPTMVDTDGDGASDLEEFVVGRDPLAPEPLSGEFTEPKVRCNLYEVGNLVYLQGMVAHQGAITQTWLGAVTPTGEAWTSGTPLLNHLQEVRTLQTGLSSVSISTFTLAIPKQVLKAVLPASLVLLVQADGVFAADQLRLVKLAPSDEIMELRELQNAHQSPGGGGVQGLFPAAPSPTVVIETVGNEVCVQVLAANGTLGMGRMLYTVADAYCDFLPGAVCLTDCRLSAGDTVVGVDIPGLLGSLNN